jgi:hypothetical protein
MVEPAPSYYSMAPQHDGRVRIGGSAESDPAAASSRASSTSCTRANRNSKSPSAASTPPAGETRLTPFRCRRIPALRRRWERRGVGGRLFGSSVNTGFRRIIAASCHRCCVTLSASCSNHPASPSSPSSASRSALAPTSRSSAWSTPCSCGRTRSDAQPPIPARSNSQQFRWTRLDIGGHQQT